MKPKVLPLYRLADEVEHFDLASLDYWQPDSAPFTALVKRFLALVRRLEDAELLEDVRRLDTRLRRRHGLSPEGSGGRNDVILEWSLRDLQFLHSEVMPIIDHLRDKLPELTGKDLVEEYGEEKDNLDDSTSERRPAIDAPIEEVPEAATKDSSDPIAAEPRQSVEAYIEEILAVTGKRITRKDFWREAARRRSTGGPDIVGRA